jgi:hypothetical protein
VLSCSSVLVLALLSVALALYSASREQGTICRSSTYVGTPWCFICRQRCTVLCVLLCRRDRANYVNITGVQLLLPGPEYQTLLSAVSQQQGRASDIDIELDDGTSFAHARLVLRADRPP